MNDPIVVAELVHEAEAAPRGRRASLAVVPALAIGAALLGAGVAIGALLPTAPADGARVDAPTVVATSQSPMPSATPDAYSAGRTYGASLYQHKVTGMLDSYAEAASLCRAIKKPATTDLYNFVRGCADALSGQ
ncbi:hypothetical protein GCM10009664_71750 [Kitasatospora gansuensis]